MTDIVERLREVRNYLASKMSDLEGACIAEDDIKTLDEAADTITALRERNDALALQALLDLAALEDALAEHFFGQLSTHRGTMLSGSLEYVLHSRAMECRARANAARALAQEIEHADASAIDAWNTRTTPANPAALRARKD